MRKRLNNRNEQTDILTIWLMVLVLIAWALSMTGRAAEQQVKWRQITIGSYSVTWPASQGGASTCLQNNGSGALSWGTCGSSGPWTSAGGIISEATTSDHVAIGGGASASELRFLEPSGSGTNYMAFKSQAMAGNVTYTLPAADGTSGYVLSTNGSGTLSWAASGTGSWTRVGTGTTYVYPTTTTDRVMIGSNSAPDVELQVQGTHGVDSTIMISAADTIYKNIWLKDSSSGELWIMSHRAHAGSNNLEFIFCNGATCNRALGFDISGNVLVGGGTSVSELRFYEPSGSGTNYMAFKGQAMGGNVTYTLPAADGTSGYVLSTNGSGTLSWVGNGLGSWTRTAGTPNYVLPTTSNDQVRVYAGSAATPALSFSSAQAHGIYELVTGSVDTRGMGLAVNGTARLEILGAGTYFIANNSATDPGYTSYPYYFRDADGTRGAFIVDANIIRSNGITGSAAQPFYQLGNNPHGFWEVQSGDANVRGVGVSVSGAEVATFRTGGLDLASGKVYKVNGTQVVGAQGAAVADASGGSVVDTEARAALNALLSRLRTHGLIAN